MNIFQKTDMVGKTFRSGGLINLAKGLFTLAIKPDNVGFQPVFAQIETTVECNLECSMCLSPSISRTNKVMTLEQFKKIIKQFPYLQKVSLVGAGEPLLNPELFDMVAYVKSRNIDTGFATNAVLLNENVSQKIISSGLDWLNISLDGASKDVYERIRRGADFNDVLKNIQQFIEIRGSKKKPALSIWFLVTRDNMGELPKMVFLVKNMGIKKLCMQTLHNWGSEDFKERIRDKNINGELQKFKGIFYKTKKTAEKNHIRFEYVNIPDKEKRSLCKRPWWSCYITTDGYVTPCCLNGADPATVNFGNILDNEFYGDIWNSKEYQDFRRKLKRGNTPGICVDCPGNYKCLKI